MAKVASIIIVSTLFCGVAQAETSKKECVAASTEGQVARDESELLEARERFLICARDECPKVVRRSCAQWLTELDDRIPSIVVRLLDAEGADVTDVDVTIDGKAAEVDGRPVLLNPGPHVVEAEGEDGKPIQKKFLLAEGEKSRLIALELASPAAEEESGPAPKKKKKTKGSESEPEQGFSVPTGAWVLGGVGVLALGSFGYFGLTASQELDDLKTSCSPGCTDDQVNPGKQKALIADISLGVSVVALGSALAWTLLSQPSTKEKDSEDIAKVDVYPLAGGAFATFRTQY